MHTHIRTYLKKSSVGKSNQDLKYLLFYQVDFIHIGFYIMYIGIIVEESVTQPLVT
jgi:hypothetical protein